MPRGRKKYTLEEHLEVTIKQIGETENTLKDLKGKKKKLEAQLKEQKLTELSTLIEETGISVDEVKDLIQSKG